MKYFLKSASCMSIYFFIVSMALFVAGCENEEFKKIQISAENGETDAQYLLGKMYSEGKNVQKNNHLSAYWYKKAAVGYQMLAEEGNNEAQFCLGLMYLNGDGVSTNETTAFNWFKKSAENGNTNAQYNLGKMYHRGIGVGKDRVIALEFYQKAAELGNADAKSALRIIASENEPKLSYYEGGQLKSKTPYKDGEIHGRVEFYNQNGRLTRSALYANGQQENAVGYNSDNSECFRIIYQNGFPVSGIWKREKNFDELTNMEQISAANYQEKYYEIKRLSDAQLLNWQNGHSLGVMCK